MPETNDCPSDRGSAAKGRENAARASSLAPDAVPATGAGLEAPDVSADGGGTIYADQTTFAGNRAFESQIIREFAPAKINLALHVVGQRPDGYHLLESIVTFAIDGAGDTVSVSAADEDRFAMTGRFAAALDADGAAGNLVVKARDLLRHALQARGMIAGPVAITLDKALPVASGIGGGSADAAATLRALSRHWGHALAEDEMAGIALALGADVPMCLAGTPLLARGIGEDIQRLHDLPSLSLVIANPLLGVSTPEIFRLLSRKDNAGIPESTTGRATEMDRASRWPDFLKTLRNDLEPPARALAGAIGDVSAALSEEGADWVRMSGSGATCFGVFSQMTKARAAASRLSARMPHWYVQAFETTGRTP